MTIRDLQPADVAACAKLFMEVFSSPPWNEAWTLDSAL